MCLTTVIATKIPSHDAEIHGWKVVAIRKDKEGREGFGPPIREYTKVWMYAPIGEWLEDPNHETVYPTKASLPKTYMAGFHAYLDREGAMLKLNELHSYLLNSTRYVIVKVTLKALLAIGTEHIGPHKHPICVSTVAVGNMIRIDAVEWNSIKEAGDEPDR